MGDPRLARVLAYIRGHLDEDVSLSTLAGRAGLSAFHLHRVFASAVGETAKQYTLRLRLERAAIALLVTDASILDVAVDSGFLSHEAFCRAFRSRFGRAPSAYRRRGLAGLDIRREPGRARRAADVVRAVGPCIGLYRARVAPRERTTMSYTVTTEEISPQPILFQRRRVKATEIALALGECLPRVFAHAQGKGIALVGPPFTRYPEWGPGLVTFEAGMPVAAAVAGEGEVEAGELQGGLVATTMHHGPYDKLSEAYAAIQGFLGAQGLAPAGAPWESYLTDPGEHPDPKDWRTRVYWPVCRTAAS